MGKKALVVGIDEYPDNPLCGCVNDAKEVASLLERNADGTKNFDVLPLLNLKSRKKLEQEFHLFLQMMMILLFFIFLDMVQEKAK